MRAGLPVALAAAALLLAAPARADRADRLAPHAVQRAVVGCWDVGGGTRLHLTPFGKHSVRFRAVHGTRPRGGPRVMTGLATWRGDGHGYELSCRPRSIHGGFCLVAPAPGGLRVRSYALRHGGGATGSLREELVATRCRP